MKRFLFFLILLLFNPFFTKAQNLALHKSYALSSLPNYKYTAPAFDKTSLTDGIYTNAHFWTTPTTVGWQSQKPVTITIDLGSIQPVGTITFNTVRYFDAGINFPKNVFAFISNNNRIFHYIGDAADTPDNVSGGFKIRKFFLKDINQNGRYITLIVVPKGLYLFCDELEVIKNNTGSFSMVNGPIAKVDLNAAIDSLNFLESIRNYLADAIKCLGDSSTEVGKNSLSINRLASQITYKNISRNQLFAVKDSIGKINALDLNTKYKEAYLINRFNPWDSLSEFWQPTCDSSKLNYKFLIGKGSVEYGSFVITNCNKYTQEFSFIVSNSNNSTSSVDLYSIPFVSTINFGPIPDPLLPIKKSVTIKPGVSLMFLFKVTGMNLGTSGSIIDVSSKFKQVKVNISTQVVDLNITNSNLNTNVWAYLYYPQLQNRKQEVIADLEFHHINTIVIPPFVLGNIESIDTSRLLNYLKGLKRVKNILLFANFNSVPNSSTSELFMSDKWKNSFIRWYSKIIQLIQLTHLSQSNVYLYPYDEVSRNRIKDFKVLINWAKQNVQGIKFYATLVDKETIDSILPLVDVAQIHQSEAALADLPSHFGEVWIYNTSGNATSLSPYRYYRLMAWQAFINGHKGIGFWNYSDANNFKSFSLYSDTTIPSSNTYSVVYNGPGKEIISSRRWEAFRLSIEDYSILQTYAKKFGLEKAKVFASEVLNNSTDINLADSIRVKMITELLK